MAASWWFCGKNKRGDQSRIAHVVRNGQAACGANLYDSTHSERTAAALGASPCKRCLRALEKLVTTTQPKEVHLRLMTYKGDQFHALDVDGLLYYFDYKWWCGKRANDPDEWAVGVRVPTMVLNQYEARAIKNAPEIKLSPAWRPSC